MSLKRKNGLIGGICSKYLREVILRRMWMTNEEIARHFRLSMDKQQDISVLAQLNNCGEMEICRILTDEGENVPKSRRKQYSNRKPYTPMHETTVRRLYEEGRTDAEIAEISGSAVSTIKKWRRDHGLPANANGKANGSKL